MLKNILLCKFHKFFFFQAHAQTILSCQCCFDEHFTMLPFINNALRNLWNDKGVRLAVARGYEYELNDSAL